MCLDKWWSPPWLFCMIITYTFWCIEYSIQVSYIRSRYMGSCKLCIYQQNRIRFANLIYWKHDSVSNLVVGYHIKLWIQYRVLDHVFFLFMLILSPGWHMVIYTLFLIYFASRLQVKYWTFEMQLTRQIYIYIYIAYQRKWVLIWPDF